MRNAVLVVGTCLALVGACFAQDTPRLTSRAETAIPSQNLGAALKQLAQSRHIQVLYLAAAVRNVRTPGASGQLTVNETLTRLLAGTGLSYRYVDADTVSIVPDQSASVPRQEPSAARERLRDPPKKRDHPSTPATKQAGLKGKHTAKQTRMPDADGGALLQEVLVTGSYIYGEHATASPTSVYTRDDIIATGAGDIYDFMRTLPTTLGDANPLAIAATQHGQASLLNNNSESVGFDLRGLGPQSTLVLINGQRLADGNINGNFVDVSLIPLNAISDIDVVKDSASSIYGSDAVGGVVNIKTLRQFSGSESSVRYGSVTSGARHDIQADQTLGASWSGGTAAFGYEYDDQTPLSAASRSFTASLPGPYTLLPEQMRHGVYASFTESPSSNLKLDGFALYGHRTDRSDEVQSGIVYRSDTDVDQYIGALQAVRTFTYGGVVTGSFDYSGNNTKLNSLTKLLGTSNAFSPYYSPRGRGTLTAASLGYSDRFGRLSGRDIGFAAGVQGREEEFSNTSNLTESYRKSRAVIAEYVELTIPVFSSVTLDGSARHEHYNDFGDTTNPKVGIQWAVGSAVTLAGTYSTSFVAPTLNELVPTGTAAYDPLPDPQKSGPCRPANPAARAGCSVVLFDSGGNPNLQPEKADTWTATARFRPKQVEGLDTSLSFYSIHQRGVINSALSLLPSVLSCLQYAGELGPAIVSSITAQQAQDMFPNAQNLFNLDEAAVSAFCDGRDLNLSRVSTEGADFDLKYSRFFGNVGLKSTVSATRILRYKSAFTSSTPAVSFLNTVNNPLALRLRAGQNVVYDDLSASAFVNYAGAYTDNIVTPAARISSWTTLDIVTTYSRSLGTSDTRRLSFTVGVDNLTNRNPPFVANNTSGFPMYFDGANASPLGRYVYMDVDIRL